MNLFEQWQFGYMVILLPIIFVLLYFFFRMLRKFAAWSQREKGPKERTSVFVIVLILLGFFAGGLLQKFVEQGYVCNQSGNAIVPCILRNTLKTL